MKLPEKIDLPCAWRGDELSSSPERWTFTLTDVEVSEIEAALVYFHNSNTPVGEISPHTFPLPTFKKNLSALRNELQQGLGFRLIRGLPVERFSTVDACTLFCGIGSYLGVARSQNGLGHLLGHVKDVGGDLDNSNVRIYQTAKRQTFHTDSCDTVGLLCLREAMEGGDSLLAATTTLYNEMLERYPDRVAFLFEPIATDRRGEVPVGANPWFEIPVLNWHRGKLTGLYQRTYIESASRFDQAPIPDARHIEALDLFDELANDPSIHLRMRLQPGDMQFVYNHTNLHDRTGFRDWPDPANRRHLLRLWLALPDDRELPPVFAERYGSIAIGDRGGIIVKGTEMHIPTEPAPV